MRSSLWIFALICALCTVPPIAAPAETSNEEVATELKEMRKALQAQNELIQKQQAKIDELERLVGSPKASVRYPEPALPEPTGARAPAQPQMSGKGSALPGQIGALLPEIGLVGDIVATSSDESADAEGNDRIAAREVELVVGSNVDPYSRFDATFAFSDFEEAAVEEAYLTRWGLPWDLKARFGRFFPRVGKTASIHRDSLSTVDEPLVIRRYFGAEGFARAGADLGGMFQGLLGLVLEPSVGILEGGTGEGGTMFGSTRRRPTLYSHLKTYKDLSDSSSMEFGLTHLAGSDDADAAFEVNTLGVDATYLNAFTPTAKLKLQSELFVQQRNDRHPWGAYALAEYRFAPQWAVGARADHVRPVDTVASRHYDQGVSAFLTFYQSEWARWRLQFQHEERASDETDDNAVFLQGTFAIGTHKHQIQ